MGIFTWQEGNVIEISPFTATVFQGTVSHSFSSEVVLWGKPVTEKSFSPSKILASILSQTLKSDWNDNKNFTNVSFWANRWDVDWFMFVFIFLLSKNYVESSMKILTDEYNEMEQEKTLVIAQLIVVKHPTWEYFQETNSPEGLLIHYWRHFRKGIDTIWHIIVHGWYRTWW